MRRRSRLTSSQRRVAAAVLGAVGAGLVPWSAALASTLPSSARVRHWALAWTGLDLAEAATAGCTAWLVARDDDRAALSATALAALLCVDAWFDVCTAPAGRDFAVALAEAAFLELPLAAGAVALARRTRSRAAELSEARGAA